MPTAPVQVTWLDACHKSMQVEFASEYAVIREPTLTMLRDAGYTDDALQNGMRLMPNQRYPFLGTMSRKMHTIVASLARSPVFDGGGCVAHLDDNTLNFNADNLAYVSHRVNMVLKKMRKLRSSRGTLVFDNVRYRTRSVKCGAEAAFARDCLKMDVALRTFDRHVVRLVYDHGLNRPLKFSEMYTSPRALAGLYRQKYAPALALSRSPPRMTTSVSVLRDAERLPDRIRRWVDGLSTPFEARDVIVVHDTPTNFVFTVIEGKHVVLLDGVTSLHRSAGNYVSLRTGERLRSVHRAVMGLGAGDLTGRSVVLHGPDGRLDNRERVLRVGTHADNMRDFMRSRG